MRTMPFLLLVACGPTKSNTPAGGDTSGTADGGGDGGAAETAPSLTLSAESIDFGGVAVGHGADATVVVGNSGTAELALTSFAIGTSAGLTLTAPEQTVLLPGATADVLLTWAPTEDVDLSGTLDVITDDPLRPAVAVPLVGTALAPAISLDPAEWDFGEVELGKNASLLVEATNTGDASLTLGGADYTASSSEMVLLDDGDADGGVLTPGESTPLRVYFKPTTTDLVTGVLTVHSDDPLQPAATATQQGIGQYVAKEFDVEITVTADDEWRAWVDGTELTATSSTTWSTVDTLGFTLEEGEHQLAFWFTDSHGAPSAFIAAVEVDGAVAAVTGDSDWLMTSSEPGTGWEESSFDDSAWSAAPACSTSSWWSSVAGSFSGTGASWVSTSTNCNTAAEAWFRVALDLE